MLKEGVYGLLAKPALKILGFVLWNSRVGEEDIFGALGESYARSWLFGPCS